MQYVALIGIAIVLLGYFLSWLRERSINRMIEAPGIVTDVQRKMNYNGITVVGTRTATVRYMPRVDGEEIEIEGRAGNARVGDEVTVLFDPEDPDGAIVSTKAAYVNMLPMLGYCLGGLLFISGIVWFFIPR